MFLGLYDVLFSVINVSRPNSFGKYSNSKCSVHMSQVMSKCTVHRGRGIMDMSFSAVMNSIFRMFGK